MNLDSHLCRRSWRFPGFRCKNGNCIDTPDVCNSWNDCGDYSDEFSTDSVICGRFESFYCRTTVFQNSSHVEGALKVKTTVVCG